MNHTNLLTDRLTTQTPLILDGGLATELEAQGHSLGDRLWSARLLRDQPDAIRAVHRAYLAAGADCITSASYQATIPGFRRYGLSGDGARALLRLSVTLAVAERDAFWQAAGAGNTRLQPLVAASVGPYGAYLADGSEYSGAYAIGRKCLAAFHRKRWAILADAQPDVMACETVPSLDEALALAELSAEYPATPTWISFSCRDDAHISDGTPLAACARQLDAFPTVAGIGINCTAPALIPALLRRLKAATDKVIVVYPNSGEQFDALRKCWVGVADSAEFATQAAEWHALGADIIGGCCRTTPRHIAAVRRRLLTS